MTRDETDRLRRLQSGSPGAFDELYTEFGDRVYRFCLRLCGRPADAEDLVQEVFVAAFRGRERFEGRSSVATWLYRIALYRWRRMRPSATERGTEPLDDETPAAGDLAEDGLTRLSLTRALEATPAGLREAFLLVKAEGLTYREAAEVLGVPQGTVQWRVHEASCRLRALLADEAVPEPRGPCCPQEASDAV